jgi:hypothetical protein
MFVLGIQQASKHLAIVRTCRGDDISSNETVVNIDADAVFVAIVVDPIFLDPSGVYVLLAQSIWIFLPALRHPPRFDFLVLLARVSLLRNWHKSRIYDLAATGLQTLGSEVLLKQLKNLLDKTRLSQSFPEEGDCSSIWNIIHHHKTDELLEGSSVIHLKFKLFITEVEKLLKH